ncbi:hypothetical protein E2542_SST17302 [Spatholobus suberectus]|nr:hypothetical protein E2542_SST17302 [Spatholobus suberectus]
MKSTLTKPFIIRCFLVSLFLSLPFLCLHLLSPHHSHVTTTTKDLRIRPGYSSYEAYIRRQLNKTLNPRLRKIWTIRDWNRKIPVFGRFFEDLKDKMLLENASKALCIGARVGQEVEALRANRRGRLRGNRPRSFSNAFDHALYPERFVAEIERTLKPSGVCVLHVALSRRADKYSANDLYSIEPLVALFKNSALVHVRSVDGFGLDTEVAFRKNMEPPPHSVR